MTSEFTRSISTNEDAEHYGWSQGEFTNIQNLAALRSDGTVICWGTILICLIKIMVGL